MDNIYLEYSNLLYTTVFSLLLTTFIDLHYYHRVVFEPTYRCVRYIAYQQFYRGLVPSCEKTLTQMMKHEMNALPSSRDVSRGNSCGQKKVTRQWTRYSRHVKNNNKQTCH